jgi:hypothetical protein
MTALDDILPMPNLLEIDEVDLAMSPGQAWELIRHGDMGRSPITRALFAVRAIPGRLAGHGDEPRTIRIDDLTSSVAHPGFQVLHDEPRKEVVVGAIGKVWQADIPFIHVASAEDFAAFYEPGFIRVAWAIQLAPRGETDTHLTFELRVDATDDASWKKFRTYFAGIGRASRFIRRSFLASLAREYGTPESKENDRPLPGDELLPDAVEQMTHGVTVAARPEAIWPWLVQMGCRRAGFYSIDALDNFGRASAREIHPELQEIRVGDVLPVTPEGPDGFEVLRVEENRALVLGGLNDSDLAKQLPFAAARPNRYWHYTWAFVLEQLDDEHTRLHVRVRVAFAHNSPLYLAGVKYVHHFMEKAQLRHLAARAEGRLSANQPRDVLAGAGGAAIMVAGFLSPFLRHARSHWGVDEATAARTYPGDEIVESPSWAWTHGTEIDAPAENVWPWVAQIGADRGGFYSYQWLENLAGCALRNAETIHPEWAIEKGGALVLHPDMPPLSVDLVAPGKWFVAHAPVDEVARVAGQARAAVSWLFFVEPLGPQRCRLISRFRCACPDDILSRLQFGPALIEPIGFAMDRHMLKGIKERAENAALNLQRPGPVAESRR